MSDRAGDLTNYLYGQYYNDIEKKLIEAVTLDELNDTWNMNKVMINLMRHDKQERVLYDMLYWHKYNLESMFKSMTLDKSLKVKKNVSTKNQATKRT